MIRVLIATLVSLWLAAPAMAQSGMACPEGDHAREMFSSGDLTKYPNYADGAGARVQKQHPDTDMFGQAKVVTGQGGTLVGVCQYSNHVGVVAMFALVIKGSDQPLKGCDNAECRVRPWWRTEYVESDPADPKLMQVCMIDREGVSYPSSDCTFLVGDAQ